MGLVYALVRLRTENFMVFRGFIVGRQSRTEADSQVVKTQAAKVDQLIQSRVCEV